jgi:hypothetical protein
MIELKKLNQLMNKLIFYKKFYKNRNNKKIKKNWFYNKKRRKPLKCKKNFKIWKFQLNKIIKKFYNYSSKLKLIKIKLNFMNNLLNPQLKMNNNKKLSYS